MPSYIFDIYKRESYKKVGELKIQANDPSEARTKAMAAEKLSKYVKRGETVSDFYDEIPDDPGGVTRR